MFVSRLLFVVVALAGIPEVVIASTSWWSASNLDLTIRIEPGAPMRVEGRMEVRLEDESSDSLVFALNSRSRAMRFLDVTARGERAKVEPGSEKSAIETAHLSFPMPLRRGEVFEVSFELESVQDSKQLVVSEQGAFASWVERWYPVPAPGRSGTESPGVRGSMTFVIPPSWRSVGNGSLVESKLENGSRIERWQSDLAVARSFAAGPYASVEQVKTGQRDIAFYQFKERPNTGENCRSLARAIEAMEGSFGPYPYPSYTVAEVFQEAKFAAGSEQGFIMVRSGVLDHPGGNLPLFAHEAGHGWWGNLMRGGGPGSKMISEALAQYGAVMSIEAIEGRAAMNEFLRFSRAGYHPLQCAIGYFHIWREGGDKPLARLESDKWDHNLSDSKGMWFYHMLRGMVGDEIFFGTLRSMLRDFAGREATLDDLRRRFNGASQDPRLAAFLAQWLDRAGAPVLRLEWWSTDGGKRIEVRIEQLQKGAFSIPLELGIETADGGILRETLALSERRQTFTLPVPARPLSVRLDPDHRLLMWRPEYGPMPTN